MTVMGSLETAVGGGEGVAEMTGFNYRYQLADFGEDQRPGR